MSGLGNISAEDFHRLQTQILDLRTANYTLQEESLKYRTELMQLNAKYEMLEKEFQKSMRTIEKSRKAKDVELLFAENEGLQRKLISQEEEFRLQNQTLLQELATLVRANEKLEKELAELKTKGQNNDIQSTTESACCTQSTECDLSTEEFTKSMEIEKACYRELETRIEELNSILETTKAENEKMQEDLKLENNQLREELASLKTSADRVLELEENLLISSKEVEKLKSTKTSLEQALESLKADNEKRAKEMEDLHQAKLLQQEKEWQEKESDFRVQLEISAAQRTEFEEAANRARQEALDAAEDVRIAERRVATVTQDLRRQLRAERRRADKLQERLRDLVSDNSTSQVTKLDSTNETDNCSVSSWSVMSGPNETSSPSIGAIQNIDSVSAGNIEVSAESQDLMGENAKLVSRLASLQQEKWLLEERVSHLEEANAAMADEMVRRGKLIQYYCMEGKSSPAKDSTPVAGGGNGEKLSVRRMVSLLRNVDESPSDQRKLQRILEETLTKNMHLQEDLERLSQEVVRLSQLAATDKK